MTAIARSGRRGSRATIATLAGGGVAAYLGLVSGAVLAAHRTPIRGRLVATTVETVRFTRPERVDFRLVRGPVPHVVERFVLSESDAGTLLEYEGELGPDLWRLGQARGDLAADRWERVVDASLQTIKVEAERLARPPPRRTYLRSE